MKLCGGFGKEFENPRSWDTSDVWIPRVVVDEVVPENASPRTRQSPHLIRQRSLDDPVENRECLFVGPVMLVGSSVAALTPTQSRHDVPAIRETFPGVEPSGVG